MSQGHNQPIRYGPASDKQADQKFCYACGVIMHVSATDCPNCGARQADAGVARPRIAGGNPELSRSGQVYCRGCGHALHQAAPLCPSCGAPQSALGSASIGPAKSKIVAALLAFFLGGFGVHKFYLGQVGLGILYLLFCWTFIPAVIALIEGIVYLATSDRRFAEKYG
jgi:RNA polymerase subunit RPABC4/transcription elongation factor Spt4